MERMFSRRARVFAAFTMLAYPIGHSYAQVRSVTPLQLYELVTDSGFLQIESVIELNDGSLVGLDLGSGSVFRIDPSRRVVEPVGRRGSGPGEYANPVRTFAMPGDTTAVLDAGNSRLLLIRPDGTTGGFLSAIAGNSCGRELAQNRLFEAADLHGRFYSLGKLLGEQTTQARGGTDSIAILRWHSACEVQVVASIPERSARSLMILDPFPARVTWAVSRDGQVAVLQPEPYRVDMISPDGVRRPGMVIAYERIRVTDAVKQGWREEQRQPIAVSISSPGKPSVSTMLPPPFEEPSQWPRYLPPYVRDAAQFAPDGRLWIRRAIAYGDSTLYDVVDTAGTLVARFRLPPGSRIVGLGIESVYVVRRDADGWERLFRYPIPG